MSEKLKPCPFCGNELMSVGWTSDRTVIGDNDDLPTATEAARIATERWNRRVVE